MFLPILLAKSRFVESDAAELPRVGSSFINKVSARRPTLSFFLFFSPPCVSQPVGFVSFCHLRKRRILVNECSGTAKWRAQRIQASSQIYKALVLNRGTPVKDLM